MVSATGTGAPVTFSMKFCACFEVAQTRGIDPESPWCQTTNPL